MTLQASGPISVGDINVELGAAAATARSLNDSALRTLAGVPSGAISLSNFYGKANFTPTTVVASNGTNTVPAGATTMVIEGWGGGGGGGAGWNSDAPELGFQGGSGGYFRSTYAVTGGQTFNVTIGAAGLRQTSSAGTNGGTTSVSSGTLSLTTMTATGGTAGSTTAGGTAGTASGGNQANTTGTPGNSNNVINRAPNGVNANTNGDVYGYGGASAIGAGNFGTNGGTGGVVMRYT